MGLARTDEDIDQWQVSVDEKVKVGMQAGVHQLRQSIKRPAVVKLAGPSPTGEEGTERRLIELATH